MLECRDKLKDLAHRECTYEKRGIPEIERAELENQPVSPRDMMLAVLHLE
jgi:hypothetical protein